MRKLSVVNKNVKSVNLFKVKYEVKSKIKLILDTLSSEIKKQIEEFFKVPINDVVKEWVTFKWAYAHGDKKMVDAFIKEVESMMKKKLSVISEITQKLLDNVKRAFLRGLKEYKPQIEFSKGKRFGEEAPLVKVKITSDINKEDVTEIRRLKVKVNKLSEKWLLTMAKIAGIIVMDKNGEELFRYEVE
jgi:hypothetical protein